MNSLRRQLARRIPMSTWHRDLSLIVDDVDFDDFRVGENVIPMSTRYTPVLKRIYRVVNKTEQTITLRALVIPDEILSIKRVWNEPFLQNYVGVEYVFDGSLVHTFDIDYDLEEWVIYRSAYIGQPSKFCRFNERTMAKAYKGFTLDEAMQNSEMRRQITGGFLDGVPIR